ncbi:conserved hypothetical protein [Xenorhabdus bovienii str. oregonense]|uniref:Uncharacterized protein n=1 Tax=Xenorhabdus bovienii str. oregonense TaxID=1398202 RepID=A0A077P4Q0_XENBV|nr:hypothetical protein [Xenorhabdus bovienii]CDH04801.1 conserved hypothetical protein [Xenorhabdus bovienii str. oregonense]
MNPIFLPVPENSEPALREDIFTVQVTGLMQHPQRPQSLREAILAVCETSSVTEAVQRLKVIHLLGDWSVPEMPSGQFRRAFFPLTVTIYDAKDNKVLGGRFYDGIVWAQPVTVMSERLSLEQKQLHLCQSATFELSWQSAAAARVLWHEANLLSLHVVSPDYQHHHEVQDILRHSTTVSV